MAKIPCIAPRRVGLLRDRHGGTFVLGAVSFLILVVVAGSGVDFGRQQLLRTRLQQAADSAAIAAAALNTSDDQERINTAYRYYRMNFPQSFLGLARPEPTITVTEEGVGVTANTRMNASFINGVNVNTLPVSARTMAKFEVIASKEKFDVVMAMDVSSSMYSYTSGVAEKYMVEIPDRFRPQVRERGHKECHDFYVDALGEEWANTPFTVQARPQRDTSGNYSEYEVTNIIATCVPPTHTLYNMELGNVHDSDDGYGMGRFHRLSAVRGVALNMVKNFFESSEDNQVAVVSWSDELDGFIPLTRNRSDLEDYIHQMYAFGGTDSTIGLVKAAEFSQEFRDDTVHAVILLTDGQNGGENAELGWQINQASLDICRRLKDSGTLIYTVGFDISAGSLRAPHFLSNCASGEPTREFNAYDRAPNYNKYFFLARTPTDLDRVFKEIFKSLQKVKLTK